MATAAASVVRYTNACVAYASIAALCVVATRHAFASGEVTDITQWVAVGLGGAGWAAGVSSFDA